jgi:hypothetical protein
MNAKRVVFCIVVVAIIAMMIGMLLPRPKGGLGHALAFTVMDIKCIEVAMLQYEAACNKLPDGSNAAIFQPLLGDNPLKIRFLDMRTNHQGEGFDPWSTAYQIEIIQGTNFVIRSAGKNRLFGDKDDFVFDSAKRDFVQKPKP